MKESKTISEFFEELINSDEFKLELDNIAENYPNLKQELHIRNVMVELLNKTFVNENKDIRAIAEYRRNGNRVDLAILDSKNECNNYFIEFKFQFTNDSAQFSKYKGTIDSDFLKRDSNMFVLIISDWSKKDGDEYAYKWNITPKLSKYICANDSWKKNIEELLDSYTHTQWSYNKLTVKKPFNVFYHIYILKNTI